MSDGTDFEEEFPPESRPELAVDAEFALLLTHDVDRPYKTVQSLYHAVRHSDPRQLKGLLPGVNPWWQFEEIMALEDDLGVRSSFYFLREPHLLAREPGDWLDPFYWVEHAGRYELDTPELLDVIDRLRDGGWEVGLHGSYDSYDDPDRLRTEKAVLESALGGPVLGGRQHHLNRGSNTWRYHREVGLHYDASPGSATEYGFQQGYRPFRPFDDEFVVFPLTLMENALPDPGEFPEAAWQVCEHLLEEAATNDAVMSVLWHPRLFAERDFPGYRRVYRRLVERALELGAWVGPAADYYGLMDHPERSVSKAEPVSEPQTGSAPESECSDSGADPAESDGGRSGDAKEADRSRVPPSQARDNKVKSTANTESTG
ncbi:polysaccharide deacetylase family protein [Halorussus litoreus]|uniref:polysaccharide deacetylase family protein n=1 Tax=Halorussus litoreus TaxID=1710536 RepID=UPI0034A374F2